tara:strand:- start:169 stop:951 length:783 start_codon:yes stop_codon:yes gene_type:complete
MKFYSSHVSWKESTNNIIVAKNVKNDAPTNIKSCKDNCSFRPNPIKHYRKQYSITDSNTANFSRNSLIGFLDKPGNSIVTKNTNCSLCGSNNALNMHTHILNNNEPGPLSGDKFFDDSLNKVVCVACNPQSLVIKSATTNLDKHYSSSAREHLQKKCKTFNQGLPLQSVNTNMKDCSRTNNRCNTIFDPSNKKYQVQGSVTSSTRISALKYGAIGCSNNKNCTANNVSYSDFNSHVNLSEFKQNCYTDRCKGRSNIRMLK